MSDVEDDDSDCWSTISKELPTLESILNDDDAGNPFVNQDFDEAEFDIPQVNQLPSLESILGEHDAESVASDEETFGLSGIHPAPASEVESKSSASVQGSVQGSIAQDATKSLDDNSVLERTVYRGISAQIMSASAHADAGRATAIAVRDLIAIGMTHGLVLVFNPNQSLAHALGGNSETKEYGSVSCMDWNADSTRLVIGYSEGSVSCYDSTNGRLIRHFTSPVSPGCSTLNVKFTDTSGTRAVVSDSGGSVWEIKIKRRRGEESETGRCLFSGARGEVVAIAPLVPGAHQVPGRQLIEETSVMSGSILALGSLSKAIVITTRPKLSVIFNHPLEGDPKSLPLLTWQAVVIQLPSNRGRVVDPVFTFGRDRTLLFFQLTYTASAFKPGKPLQFLPLKRLDLDYSLLAVSWLSAHVFAAIDSTEKLHIRDARLTKELPEVVDLAGVEMIYGSADFKGFSTGGKVSKALVLVADRACYYSLAAGPGHGRMVFLGMNGVHAVTLRTWEKRVEYFLNRGRYIEALTLCDEVLTNKAVACIGFGQKRAEKRLAAKSLLNSMLETVNNKPMELLPTCLTFAMKLPPEFSPSNSLSTYPRSDVESVTREAALSAIFDAISSNPAQELLFFSALQPNVLDGDLTFLSPSIVQRLVAVYEAEGKLDDLESWLVRLEIHCLDFDQVVRLCIKYSLVDAYLSCHNRGLGDYVSPLEDLISRLETQLLGFVETFDAQTLPPEVIKLGNKLLVYISCCLAGRAYPLFGPLVGPGEVDATSPGSSPPPSCATSVKFRVLACLTSIHTRNARDDELPYPRLRALLRFDSLGFLNVLSMAFEEPEFQTDLGLRQKQRLVDILVQIVFENGPDLGIGPSASDHLLLFLAREAARGENAPQGGHQGGSPSTSGLHLSTDLWSKVVHYLASCGKPNREERQAALVHLLSVKTEQVDWPLTWDEMTEMAEDAEFFRVCELLYERKGAKDKILTCYLKDPGRRDRIFPYLRSHLRDEDEVVVSRASELVSTDAEEFAAFVANVRPDLVSRVIDGLGKECESSVLFRFLDALTTLIGDGAGPKSLELDSPTWELYFECLATHRPSTVVSSLKKYDGLYRFDPVYKSCEKHGIAEGRAYLLEKSGDFRGALKILLEDVEEQLGQVTELESDVITRLGKVESKVLVIIEACQRHCRHGSAGADDASTEGWFSLLGLVLKTQRGAGAALLSEMAKQGLMEIAKHIIASMLSYVSLPTILQKLLRDPAYRTGKFGEVRDLILGMTKAYNYEVTVMESARNLSYREKAGKTAELIKRAQSGIGPRTGTMCSLCQKKDGRRSRVGPVVFFRKCGHWFHELCLKEDLEGSDGEDEDGEPRERRKFDVKVCPRCADADMAQEALERHLRKSEPRSNTVVSTDEMTPILPGKAYEIKFRQNPLSLLEDLLEGDSGKKEEQFQCTISRAPPLYRGHTEL